jgi:ParB family transcriptional regulator, chromosome partitioning protein
MEMEEEVQLIPVDKIHVLNPRNRDPKKFAQLVASIAHLGLKRPIVVSRRAEIAGDTEYDLVCGQGRLEAFIQLKQAAIPAIVEDRSREERLLRSLVENCARRTARMLEMVKQVGILRDRGYNNTEIARKIDLDDSTVGVVLKLLDQGEERLLQAVEAGRIPWSVAAIIATSSDKQVQKALTQAYDDHGLRGKPLLRAIRLVEQRRAFGKHIGRGPQRASKPVTPEGIVRAFEQENKRQRLVIKKAELCDTRLLFIVNALKSLLADENFRNLLRAERLDTLPAHLAEQIERS